MGRRTKPAHLDQAQGFPSKRRTKAERQIAEAQHLATLLAALPADSADPLAPPSILLDHRLAPALAVWREYTPVLAQRNLFGPLDRHTFALFCVYCAEFITAQVDILDKGTHFMVTTSTSGDKRPWDNPSVARRDTAQRIMMEMARKFGLTPLDYFALMAQQAGAGSTIGSLFAQIPAPEAPAPAHSGAGRLATFDSAPPATLQ